MLLPITGRYVCLEPLESRHTAGLIEVSGDPALWRYMSFANLAAPAAMASWVEEAKTEPERGTGHPFVLIDIASRRVAGSSSLYDVNLRHRRAELGRTWLGASYQRTGINTEAKLLLLTYAFEQLHLRRVQLKASAGNQRSRQAIERLGARFEGLLRSFATLPDGSVSDTALYSITDVEWPEVKSHLQQLLR